MLDIINDLRNHFRGISFLLVLLSFVISSLNPFAQAAAVIMVLLVLRDGVGDLLNYRQGFRKFENQLRASASGPVTNSKGKMIGAYLLRITLGRLGEFFFWLGLFGVVAQTEGAYILVILGLIFGGIYGAIAAKLGILETEE